MTVKLAVSATYLEATYTVVAATEEPEFNIVCLVEVEENLEECAFSALVVVTEEEYQEECEFSAAATITGEDILYGQEEGSFSIFGIISGQDLQNYYLEQQLEIIGIVKSKLLSPIAPLVKGKNPRSGETAVAVNKPVEFYVCPGVGGDGVDISTVTVKINGVSYDHEDPEFTYSGTAEGYLIQVGHPDWGHLQQIDVEIDAFSLCGIAMEKISYSFSVIWDSANTREAQEIELFQSAVYTVPIVTMQENWVRQGVERYTEELELWWGRFQLLPYIEDMQLIAIAGDTNALGKEVIDNGYLKVKVEDGSYQALSDTIPISLGPMFTHTHKSLFFKLLVPEEAATKQYFVVGLRFEPKFFFPYGRWQYGKGIYGSGGNVYGITPREFVYRAFVFDQTMWNAFLGVGVTVPYMTYRGEDKKW